MRAVAGEVVNDQPVRRLDEQDATTMTDRRRQTRVCIMMRIDEVAISGRLPRVERDGRLRAPRKWPGRLRLTQPVHAHGAVRKRAAQVIAPVGFGDVAV